MGLKIVMIHGFTFEREDFTIIFLELGFIRSTWNLVRMAWMYLPGQTELEFRTQRQRYFTEFKPFFFRVIQMSQKLLRI